MSDELNMRARELLASEHEPPTHGSGRVGGSFVGHVPEEAALRAIERALSQDTGFAEGIEAAAKVAEEFRGPPPLRHAGTCRGIAKAIRSLLPSSPVVGRDE